MLSLERTLKVPHVVIIGSAYAGLSALNALVSLADGKALPEGRKGPPAQGVGGQPNGIPGPITNGTKALEKNPLRPLKVKPRYTILDERDGFYHTLGAPLGQISAFFGQEFWVKHEDIAATKSGVDLQFIQGSVESLDMKSKNLTYLSTRSKKEPQTLSYDFLVVASGMRRKWPIVPQSLDYETYLKDVIDYEIRLSQKNKIVLVGGGACGIEMAAELKVHFPEKEIILIHSRSQLLSNEPLPENFKNKALDLLIEQGVDVRINSRLEKDTASEEGNSRSLLLSTGEILTCDEVIYTAAQQHANTNFLPESLKEGQWGCVKVRDTFQFATNLPNADLHYAVGDAAHWPSTIKRCGPAQNQGKQAAANIIASLLALEDGKAISEATLEHSPPSTPSMTLAVGEQAVTMRFGMKYGKEVKMRAFGTGLGIDGSLANLGLRPRRSQVIEHTSVVLDEAKI